MDYSLLVGIETLDEQSLTSRLLHSKEVEAAFTATSFRPTMEINTDIDANQLAASKREDKQNKDIGRLMSRTHCFVNGKRVYHFAVIDYLQEWNLSKKAERFTKTVLLGKDGATLSAIEPNQYAQRFQCFMERNVIY